MKSLHWGFLLAVVTLDVSSGASSARSQDPCDPKQINVGRAEGVAGRSVEVEVTGVVSCEVTGFSFAVGHAGGILRFVGAAPGQFFVDHAGADLSFQGIGYNAEGYALIYCLFDISNPITVPPTAIPQGTVLATLTYEILESAQEGETPLLNRTRTYGSPNPISNIYSGKPGDAPIEPQLADGLVAILTGEPEGEFLRGDSNDDGELDISDPVYTLNFLFLGSTTPACEDAADANDDGEMDLSDAIWMLSFLFQGGPAPPAPGPFLRGPDPTPDGLGCTRS